MQRLKELERENARLRQMYADQALVLTAVKDAHPKTVRRSARRAAVTILTEDHGLSV